jgi:hypothetical protein
MVGSLLASTKYLQEMLRQWSLRQLSEQQVVDAYLRVGADFNSTVTAFQYYNIDLRRVVFAVSAAFFCSSDIDLTVSCILRRNSYALFSRRV